MFNGSNILYFKSKEYLQNCLLSEDKILIGKVVISDFPELSNLCNINGIVHVYNQSEVIPNEDIDYIICNDRNEEFETEILKKNYKMSIIYIKLAKKWCFSCNNLFSEIKNCGKYCSEKCVRKDLGFDSNYEVIKSGITPVNNLEIINNILASSEREKNTKSVSNKVMKDAMRLKHAVKRGEYKKEMRQPSLRKISSVKEKSLLEFEQMHNTTKYCEVITKKGTRCPNRAIGNTNFCGIISHMNKSLENQLNVENKN